MSRRARRVRTCQGCSGPRGQRRRAWADRLLGSNPLLPLMIIAIILPMQAAAEHDQATATPTSTRDRILAAAAEVFAERGYEGAAMSDVARRAGFTTGAIYGRFRDKAELLLEVVRGALEAQQEAAVVAAASATGDGVPARFAELVAEFVDPGRASSRALVLEAHVAARRDEAVGELQP